MRVEHVKENEAGEGHGGVLVGDLPVLHHSFEDVERPADDDSRWEEDVDEDVLGQHGNFGVPRRLLHQILVRGFNPEALSRRPVHDYVYPKYLHSIQRVCSAH